MDIFKSNKLFFILMGALIGVLIGSSVYYWMEKNITKQAKSDMETKKGALEQLRNIDPTSDHVKLLEAAKVDSKETFDEIVKALITWNDYRVEAAGIGDIVAFIREDVGYKEIKESTVRKWIDDKKLKSFNSPDGSYYVLRPDLKIFFDEARKSKPSEDYPKEFIDALIASTTRTYISETPTLFLGKLKDLQTQIKLFAKKKEVIIKDPSQAIYISFDKYLSESKPPAPTEDLIPLIKQRNAVRDIMFLLIESQVYEIISVQYLTGTANERKSDFYAGHDFEVKFAATYPAVARFMNMILSPTKHELALAAGLKDILPKNLYVVTDIMYTSEEAEMEVKRKQDYESKKKDEEAAKKMIIPPTSKKGGYNPYESGFGKSKGVGATPTAEDLGQFKDWYKKRDRDAMKSKEVPGRAPKHNIIIVTMTISFVDLMGADLTGEPGGK